MDASFTPITLSQSPQIERSPLRINPAPFGLTNVAHGLRLIECPARPKETTTVVSQS